MPGFYGELKSKDANLTPVGDKTFCLVVHGLACLLVSSRASITEIGKGTVYKDDTSASTVGEEMPAHRRGPEGRPVATLLILELRVIATSKLV